VLAEAGLISREKRGRVTWCKLEPDALREASVWMQAFGQFEAVDLDAFERFLAAELAEDGEPGRGSVGLRPPPLRGSPRSISRQKRRLGGRTGHDREVDDHEPDKRRKRGPVRGEDRGGDKTERAATSMPKVKTTVGSPRLSFGTRGA
jgi:hypothetical protein